jgi:hypothetical protein
MAPSISNHVVPTRKMVVAARDLLLLLRDSGTLIIVNVSGMNHSGQDRQKISAALQILPLTTLSSL